MPQLLIEKRKPMRPIVPVHREQTAPLPGLESPSVGVRQRVTEHRRQTLHRQQFRERLIEWFLFLNGLIAVVAIALIFVFLFREGFKAFQEIHPSRFLGHVDEDYWTGQPVFKMTWQPVGDNSKYSIIPLICGTFLVAVPATILAGLFGVGCGIYLAELASPKVREIAKPIVELLAGIPSVVLGFFCLAVLATWMQNLLHTTFRLNAAVGAVGVAIAIIPVIASVTEDALRAVPDDLREAALGLGATKGETIVRVLIPAAISGITAAVLLGLGRAIGETMIVLMATGNAGLVTANPFSSVRTMTATIAAELGAVAQGSQQYQALFLVGAILFTITFLLNLVAEVVVHRMRSQLKL